jgi:hypothetical protein
MELGAMVDHLLGVDIGIRRNFGSGSFARELVLVFSFGVFLFYRVPRIGSLGVLGWRTQRIEVIVNATESLSLSQLGSRERQEWIWNFGLLFSSLFFFYFTDARTISVGQSRPLLGRRLCHLVLGALERKIGVCALLLCHDE